jgi:hypothetical protein
LREDVHFAIQPVHIIAHFDTLNQYRSEKTIMQSFETFGFDSDSEDDLPFYQRILRKYREDEFALLCSSLRQNDPFITKVKTERYFPRAYGRLFGESLRDNNRLEQISLRLDSFSTNEEHLRLAVEPAACLLHFLRTSSALRSVTVRGPHWFHYHLSDPILRAVVKNPHDRLFELNLMECSSDSLGTLCTFLKTTTSLKFLRVTISDRCDSASLELLPAALAENQTLEGLTLRVRIEFVTLISSCVRQLRLHAHQRLCHLNLGNVSLDYFVDHSLFRELEAMLGSSPTLRHLGLRGFRFEKDDMETLVRGLLSSRYITSMSFQHCQFDSDVHTLFTSYLQAANTEHHSLRSLDLQGTDFESPSALI